MLAARESGVLGLPHDEPEELAADLVFQKALAVLGKRRGVEAGAHHVHVEEPAEQQVVVELLAELPLAADREQRHQNHGLEQPLRRNGCAADPAVHLVELSGELGEGPVSEHLHLTKTVVLRDSVGRGNQAQHRRLLGIFTAHDQ